MKRWQSHKVVEADVIHGWVDNPTHKFVWIGEDRSRFDVPHNFFTRGFPREGDYLVRYEDGYLSWSPKKAFEEGYAPFVDRRFDDIIVSNHRASFVITDEEFEGGLAMKVFKDRLWRLMDEHPRTAGLAPSSSDDGAEAIGEASAAAERLAALHAPFFAPLERWEYVLGHADNFPALGNDGWELVMVAPGSTGGNMIFVFRRRKHA